MTTKLPAKPSRRRRLGITLHPGQREVNRSKARFRVVACGRQWGKTRYAAAWAFKRAASGQRGWWIAPDANIADIGWEVLRKLASQLPDVKIRESMPRTLEFPAGGWLQVKGAHLPGKLRARTLHFVVVDEAAFIEDSRRWYSELRPTLAINRGEGLFISTFNGENWFYDLYELGQNPDEPEWESWRKPSSENPYLSAEEIEAARRITPHAEFEQEWLANPLVYVGAVFPGEDVQRAVERGASPREWPEGTESYAGLDWGHNTTAFEVNEEHPTTDEVRWVEEGDWRVMPLGPDPEKKQLTKIDLIVDASRRRNILVIYADAAGATENAALKAALRSAGLNTEVVAVPFGKYKDKAIVARRWYLEQGLESMSPECPELIRTTKRYHYKEDSEDVVKEDDHPVDASIAFYASRRGSLVESSAR